MKERLFTMVAGLACLTGGVGLGMAAQAGAAMEPEPHPATDRVTPGEMVVNLKGGGGGRLLRLELDISLSGEAAELARQRMPAIQDALLSHLCELTWHDLEGMDGKLRLKSELPPLLDDRIAPHRVDEVFITTLVVQ